MQYTSFKIPSVVDYQRDSIQKLFCLPDGSFLSQQTILVLLKFIKLSERTRECDEHLIKNVFFHSLFSLLPSVCLLYMYKGQRYLFTCYLVTYVLMYPWAILYKFHLFRWSVYSFIIISLREVVNKTTTYIYYISSSSSPLPPCFSVV